METISVHDLQLDRSFNPRLHGVDQEVVEHYASIFKEVIWPPILVDRASRRLIDGWHRVEAAKRVGVYSLPVQWVDAKEDELFALAIKANLAHGIRLSREERFKAIVRLQREGWTPDRIAEVLGVSEKMVDRTEKAEDLRIRFKVRDMPGAMLPTESLVEVVKLPDQFHEELAEIACDVEAAPGDVRRAVASIKRGDVETAQDIRRVMMDPEFAKARKVAAAAMQEGGWLMTFATLVDQLEATPIGVSTTERDAATMLFRRMQNWAARQLMQLGVDETPAML